MKEHHDREEYNALQEMIIEDLIEDMTLPLAGIEDIKKRKYPAKIKKKKAVQDLTGSMFEMNGIVGRVIDYDEDFVCVDTGDGIEVWPRNK